MYPPQRFSGNYGKQGLFSQDPWDASSLCRTRSSEVFGRFPKKKPDHDVFRAPHVDFTHLVPYYLHGDGGRTYKKDSILICSMFPALGEGTSSNPVDLYPVPGQPQKMKGRKRKHAHGDSTGQDFEAGINLLGNTLASRFLFAPLKVEFHKKKPEKV